jgi:transcriptional regulator with XRE-family HTH domain
MINILINNQTSMSDSAIVQSLGSFIKEYRIRQNKSQTELANNAGVSRMTLSFFENGKNSSLLTFIQLLRALNILYTLDTFTIEQQVSPLLLAKQEKMKRQRAGRTEKKVIKTKSDW